MQIQYNGKSKILRRIVELVNRSQNIALRQDSTDKNTLYWTGLDGVEITVNIPSGAVEVDAELSETSTNPVENQAITKELAKKAEKSAIPTVGDGVLSVQRNGKSVGTFSANAAENVSVNIPVPEKVSELENDTGYGTYTKPATGIPKSDLASGVQASLGKADTALQKHQDISGKLDKTGDASSTTVAFSAASARENVKTGEKLSAIVGKIAKWFVDLKAVAFTGSYNDLANKPTIPDISGKQDKSTAVTHTANTAVGSATKPVYVAANGVATAISHAINADVPANAKFTDTTYSNATQSSHGLMTAADKKKLDGMDLSQYLPLHGTADKAVALTNGAMRYGWCVNNNASANSGYRWFRVGTMTASKTGYDTEVLYLHVCEGYGRYGVLCAYTRVDNTGVGVETMRLSWVSRDLSESRAHFKLVAINSSTGVKFELWCFTSVRWNQTAYYVIADIKLTGGLLNRWVLETHGDADAKNATTAGTKSVTDVDLSYAAQATTLTDSGWTAMTVEGYYAKSGTVKYRTYGKQITITGSVVLKNDIATSYPAPQDIASTTFDFSSIVGCSGVGRSSSGVGAYVTTENYGGENLVCVNALGSKIAAGSTLNFTITGFID